MNGTPFLCTLPNSARVYGLYWGEGEASLVLLHDLGEDLDSVGPLARSVSRRGWRTVAIDLPGHGLSDAVPGNGLSRPSLAALHAYMVGRGWGPLFVAAVGGSAELALAWSGLPQVLGSVLISPTEVVARSRHRLTTPTLVFVPSHRPEMIEAAQVLCAGAQAYWLRALLPTDKAGSELFRGRWLSQINSHLVGFVVEVLGLHKLRAARGDEPSQPADEPPSPSGG